MAVVALRGEKSVSDEVEITTVKKTLNNAVLIILLLITTHNPATLPAYCLRWQKKKIINKKKIELFIAHYINMGPFPKKIDKLKNAKKKNKQTNKQTNKQNKKVW